MPYFAFAISYPLWLSMKLQENWLKLLRGEGVNLNKTPE